MQNISKPLVHNGKYMQMWAIAGFKLIKPQQFKAGYSP
jgi:hypothetical protein